MWFQFTILTEKNVLLQTFPSIIITTYMLHLSSTFLQTNSTLLIIYIYLK